MSDMAERRFIAKQRDGAESMFGDWGAWDTVEERWTSSPSFFKGFAMGLADNQNRALNAATPQQEEPPSGS